MKNVIYEVVKMTGYFILIIGIIASVIVGVYFHNNYYENYGIIYGVCGFVSSILLGTFVIGLSKIILILKEEQEELISQHQILFKKEDYKKHITYSPINKPFIIVVLIVTIIAGGISSYDGIMDLTHESTDELIDKLHESSQSYYDTQRELDELEEQLNALKEYRSSYY